MSALAVLCAWEWYARRQTRWAVLTGLFTGIGLLAHFDAPRGGAGFGLHCAPRLRPDAQSGPAPRWGRDVALGGLCTLLAVIPFYVPYLLTPQAGVTGSYLGRRIGEGLLKNTIGNFLTYGIFYNSFLYLALTGGLVLAFMAWRVHNAPALRRVLGGGSGRPRCW